MQVTVCEYRMALWITRRAYGNMQRPNIATTGVNELKSMAKTKRIRLSHCIAKAFCLEGKIIRQKGKDLKDKSLMKRFMVRFCDFTPFGLMHIAKA